MTPSHYTRPSPSFTSWTTLRPLSQNREPVQPSQLGQYDDGVAPWQATPLYYQTPMIGDTPLTSADTPNNGSSPLSQYLLQLPPQARRVIYEQAKAAMYGTTNEGFSRAESGKLFISLIEENEHLAGWFSNAVDNAMQRIFLHSTQNSGPGVPTCMFKEAIVFESACITVFNALNLDNRGANDVAEMFRNMLCAAQTLYDLGVTHLTLPCKETGQVKFALTWLDTGNMTFCYQRAGSGWTKLFEFTIYALRLNLSNNSA
jgi:hypothetical protein